MFSLADIYEREANGALKDFARLAEELLVLDEDEVPIRFLWLTPRTIAQIVEWDKNCRLGALAELADFLVGKPVLWGDLREGNHMKPLNPETGWIEFKVRTSPQVRIYGAFVSIDHFVGIHACNRSEQPDDIDGEFSLLWQQLWGHDGGRICGGDPSEAVTNYRMLK